MSAGKLDLYAEQGATFSRKITWKDSAGDPIDLTGATARMQVRKTVRSTDIALELTTENGRITIASPTNGEIDLLVSAADMENIADGAYRYDLEVAIGAAVTRLLEDVFTVSPEITR